MRFPMTLFCLMLAMAACTEVPDATSKPAGADATEKVGVCFTGGGMNQGRCPEIMTEEERQDFVNSRISTQ